MRTRRRCASSTLPSPEARGVTLNGPITMVPTAVLVKQGREVDRIPGYWGPDNFFKMVSYLISKAE